MEKKYEQDDKVKTEFLSGYSRFRIEKLFQNENEKNKLNDIKNIGVYKNIFEIASDIFKIFSKKINENNNNIKIKKIYLCEIEKECLRLVEKELKSKIKILKEKKSDSGTETGNNNSANLVEVIDDLIKSIDKFIEKQNNEKSTYDDLAKIFDCALKLCELVAKTIETVEEISTLCSILKIVAELASLIHPLLLQLQTQLKIDFKIEINKINIKEEFEKLISDIVKTAIKEETMIKKDDDDNNNRQTPQKIKF
jgi:hypothetical protein